MIQDRTLSSRKRIQEAADLAARYSQGKHRSKIAVGYCLVMDVDKPKYAEAETVVTNHERVMYGYQHFAKVLA